MQHNRCNTGRVRWNCEMILNELSFPHHVVLLVPMETRDSELNNTINILWMITTYHIIKNLKISLFGTWILLIPDKKELTFFKALNQSRDCFLEWEGLGESMSTTSDPLAWQVNDRLTSLWPPGGDKQGTLNYIMTETQLHTHTHTQ